MTSCPQTTVPLIVCWDINIQTSSAQCNLDWRCHVIKHLITLFIPMNWTTKCMLDYCIHVVPLETFRLQHKGFVCSCWDLTSHSTTFQWCRDVATGSRVLPVLSGSKVSCSRHNTAEVGRAPTSGSGVRRSTTEPPRSPIAQMNITRTKID